MDIDAILRAHFAPQRRTAWLPLVLQQDGPAWSSKFGGAPFLPDGERHPTCANCDRPMELLLQLDVASLPNASRCGGDGLLQVYLCTGRAHGCGRCYCGQGEHGPRSLLTRRIPAGVRGCASQALVGGALIPKQIVEWEPGDDYPDFDEPQARAVEAVLSADECDAWLDHPLTLAGEKLGGWPVWIQAAARPRCPRCNDPMESIFQIESNDLVDVMWGDMGVAHLFQCARHPDELAFDWDGH